MYMISAARRMPHAACDYPDYAGPVAKAVASGEYEVGILLDGSGIGMSIAANKGCGIRAALVHDEVTARLARESNHCNVLCIGTDLLSEDQLRTIVGIFLNSSFAGGRHVRRVAKIGQLEAAGLRGTPAKVTGASGAVGHVHQPVRPAH